MNTFILQKNGIEPVHFEQITRVLNRLDIKYIPFTTINKENTITSFNEIIKEDNIISVCGTSFLRITENNQELKNKNSIDYDIHKFDQFKYKDLNLPLLNSNSEYLSFNELKDYVFKKDMFIKPSTDLKTFNGGIILENETILNYLYRTGGNIERLKNETIIVSPLKKIYSEYRFFMYQNEILGCSRYVLNNQYSADKLVPEYMKEKAIEYSKLYTPLDFYVLDLAETDKGIEIVEFQCWNMSAFYESNIMNILGSINEIKGNR